MTADETLDLVSKMRDAQKEYEGSRTVSAHNAKDILESQVDAALKERELRIAESVQPGLFT